MRVHTVGHANRSLDDLVGVLLAHGIRLLVDVRSYPGSKRNPQFARASLEQALPAHGIGYRFLGRELGGFRKHGNPETPHVALTSDMFRNYADHMESEAFASGVEALLGDAAEHPAAILCAERHWSRCHRSFVADHLVGLRDVEVVHLLDESKAEPHRLHATARVEPQRIVYDRVEQPDLPGF